MQPISQNSAKKYVSSIEASSRFGVTNDYVSLLCRQGKVAGRRIGRQWLVEPESLQQFLLQMQQRKTERSKELSNQFKEEYAVLQRTQWPDSFAPKRPVWYAHITDSRIEPHVGFAAIVALPVFLFGAVFSAQAFESILNGPSPISYHEVLPDLSVQNNSPLVAGATYATRAMHVPGAYIDTSSVPPQIAAPSFVVSKSNVQGAIAFVPLFTDSFKETLSGVWSNSIGLTAQVFVASVYEMGSDSNQIASAEFNMAAAWDAWSSVLSYTNPVPQPTLATRVITFKSFGNTKDTPAVEKPLALAASATPAPTRARVPAALVLPAPAAVPQPVYKPTPATNLTAYVTQKSLTEQLNGVTNAMRQLIYNQNAVSTSSLYSSLWGAIALSQRIDSLPSTVTIGGSPIVTQQTEQSVTSLSGLSGLLGIGQGGTGTSTAPVYGQMLVGNNFGGYDLVATSSLGIASGGVGGGTTYTFTYPFINSANTISLAFGTTTPNFWSAYNNFSSLFAANASTTNATTTNLHITSLSNGGLAADQNGRVYSAATSTLATISGTLALTQLANQAANSVLVNNTANPAAPVAIATSSFFGIGTGGQVLGWNNGVPQWIASTTYSAGSGITTSFANGILSIVNAIGYPFVGNATTTQIAFNGGLTTTGATSTGTLAVTGSTTIASILNVGGQLNANLSAVIASTTLTGKTLLVNATSTTFAVTGSSTVAGQFNAVGGATLGSLTAGASTLSSLTIGSLSGLIGANNGVTYSFASSSLFGYVPLNPTRQILTTFPLAGGGDLSADRTITFGGLSTSTAAVQGNIPYFSGVNTFANVATGTITGSTGLSVTAGQSVIGSGLTITNTGVTSNVAGTGISLSGGTGAVTITNTIGYPFVGNATTTQIAFNGGLTTTGATSTGTLAITSSTTLASLLNVGGALNANNGGTFSGTFAGAHTYSGAISFSSTIGVTGLSTLTGGLTTTGATSTGTFAVTGSTTIASLLNIGGALNANGSLTVTGVATLGNASSSNLSANLAMFGSTGTTTITAAGRVGVGTSTVYAKLTVWGTDVASSTLAFNVVNNSSTTVFAVFDGGNAQLSGTLTQSSDQRLKTNIATLDGSSTLAALVQLNPVMFNWIDPNQGTAPQVGFIAQEVQKIFPNLVSTTTPTALTPDGTLGVNYIGFISPVISAMQELSKQITALANTVAGFADSFTTKVVHTNEICVQKSDGSEFCANGDQLAAMAASASATPSAPADQPAPAQDTSDASSTPTTP
jgi:hypothetical protein